LEDENVLVLAGFVVSGGADADHLASTETGELQLESEDVPSITGLVSDLELVGEFVQLEDVEHFSDNIEVTVGGASVLEVGVVVGGETIILGEVVRNPLAEGGEESSLMLLESSALTRVVGGLVAIVLTVEHSP